ncbi:tellurite resistance/C4-dicarboxylate transporter family protein [Hymenobacter seoulensis]
MKKYIQQFSPVYFALVMSTGIISLAADGLQLSAVAKGFFYLNLVLYPVCFVLLLLWIVLNRKEVLTELTSHKKGALFLAFVPATCLLGNQVVQLRQFTGLGNALWVLAAVAWLVLLYSFLIGVSVGKEKPALEKGFNGSWLLLVVATEALAVLGAKLLPSWNVAPEVSTFALLGLFLLGSLLYVVLSTLLFYRLTFKPLGEKEVGAAYWISVGASAITVLAGSSLATSLAQHQVLPDLLPFVKGTSLLFWAVSTFWIPLVAGLRLWNHLKTRPAFTYTPAYWSMVFPLGMYTAATLRLSESLKIPQLRVIPANFFYVAMLAWLLTFGGMLYQYATTAGKQQEAWRRLPQKKLCCRMQQSFL